MTTATELEPGDSTATLTTALLDAPAQEVSQPARPAKRSTRYLSLDIWRGLACLMLVMYHATFYCDHSWRTGDRSTWTLTGLIINLLGRMWIGVPIFFVVSGYCIAASCDAARGRTHSLRTYFWRRFHRIYPPLWIACALCVLFVLAVTTFDSIRAECVQLPVFNQFTVGNWIGNLLAAESWRANLWGHQEYLMKNTWTLCYEEQFYAVVGVMLLFGARRFFAAAAFVALGTLVTRHLSRAAGGSLAGFFCDGHWLLFAMGILVYYRLQYAPARLHRWIGTFLAAVAVYAVVDYRLAPSHFEKHVDEYLFTSALFGFVAIRLYRKDKQISEHPLLQPLAWYGKMSYSVYLTHFPVVVVLSYLLSRIGSTADWFAALVTVPLCIAVSIPLGRAFHLAVERRFMNAPLAKAAV